MANRSYLELFIPPPPTPPPPPPPHHQPKSYQDIWGKLETSIEMAINDTTIDDVIITGDYNDNQNSCTIKDELPFN